MPIENVCFDCGGGMKRPDPVHSYDFNTDGWVPHYCLNCGLCSDSNAITNRFIKNILQTLTNDYLDQDYKFKSELFSVLKQMTFFDFRDLAKQIVSHCNEYGYSITTDNILDIIDIKLSYSTLL